jgi:hypothetical protein
MDMEFFTDLVTSAFAGILCGLLGALVFNQFVGG